MEFRHNPRKPIQRALTEEAKRVLTLMGASGGYSPQPPLTTREKETLARLVESGLAVRRVKKEGVFYLITLQGRRLV